MEDISKQQLQDTLKIIDSSIINCEKVQPKLKEGSPQLSLSKDRIKALYIAKSIMLKQRHSYTEEELHMAIKQIASIQGKSNTGLHNAKEHSATYTRFMRIKNAMDIILSCLQEEINEPYE